MPRCYAAFVKGESAKELEAQAAQMARDFFGPHVRLVLSTDYTVSLYGDERHGAVIRVHEIPAQFNKASLGEDMRLVEDQ